MNLESLTSKVVLLASQTAQFVKKTTSEFDKSRIEYKGLNDLVSFVDKETELRLVKGLSTILPNAGFIAEEETSSKTEHQDLFWVIDPVDGTTNYIHGVPVFAISIALMKDNEVLIGVVHEINRDESFYAWKDGGAFLNGKSIKVSTAQHLSESLIATGFPYYDFALMDKYIAILRDLMQKTHGVRRLGAASVDLVYTACGRFEGFFEYNLKPWDVAAGSLIVQEAGGFVSDFSGQNNFVFGAELIAGCGVFFELKALIQERWKM